MHPKSEHGPEDEPDNNGARRRAPFRLGIDKPFAAIAGVGAHEVGRRPDQKGAEQHGVGRRPVGDEMRKAEHHDGPRDPEGVSAAQALDQPAPSQVSKTEDKPASGTDLDADSLSAVAERRSAMPPIILGNDMANELGAKVGSVVTVTSPQGELSPYGLVPKYARFRVAGIFHSGFYDYDLSWAFARLSDAQRLFATGDVIEVIQFKIDDIYKAAEIGRALEQAAGPGFSTTNWMEQQKPLFHALKLERLVTFITVGLIVFVAALNILISLTMMVMEKTRDIAVLMSMGTRKAQVRRIFIAQGALIGLLGTSIGLLLGYLLSWLGGHYHVFPLAPEVYSIDYVPFAPEASDGILIALVAMGTSLVATLYPSWSAARVLPAEALRYE